MQLTNPSPNVKSSTETSIIPNRVSSHVRRAWDWLTHVKSDDPVRLALNRGFATIIVFLLCADIMVTPVFFALNDPAAFVSAPAIAVFLFIWWLNRRGTALGITLLVVWTAITTPLGSVPATYVEHNGAIPLVLIFPIVAATLFIRPRAGLWSLLLLISSLGLALLASNVSHEAALRFVVITTVNLGAITAFMMVGAAIFTRALRTSTAANESLKQLNAELEARSQKQKRTEEALADERNLLRTLIASLPYRIIYKDTLARFRMINTNHAYDLGISSPDEAIGKSDFDFFPEDIARQYYDDDMVVLHSGEPLMNREEVTLDNQGNRRWLLTNKFPLRDHHGQVTGLIGIAVDITERKDAEAQRLELALARERTDLLKEFLNTLSHDLKTPLSVINTSLYLLRKSRDPEQQERKLEQISLQAQHLEKLIQDILAVSRLDAAPELIFQPTQLNQLIERIQQQFQTVAEERALTVELALDLTLAPVLASEAEMQRALVNLIENALHYTPAKGKVSIRTVRQDDQAIIEISDTGIGIDAADLSRIFDPFYRADRARATDVAGTGLGLAIVHKIVEIHGGSIEVESAPGQGSTFRVRLPAAVEQMR
jgi:PAS domain S-box-containing protein